jgi:hypothetical protein
MTATATRRSRRNLSAVQPEQPAEQPAEQSAEQPATGQSEQPAAGKQATIAELSAALRDALTAGDTASALELTAQLEASSAKRPPAPKGRTAANVKRLTAQAIVDALAADLDRITAGPEDEPFTDAERETARQTVAAICSYLPGAKSLTWPDTFAKRTVLSTEKPADPPSDQPTEQPATEPAEQSAEQQPSA